MARNTANAGFLAYVDAGKTPPAERLPSAAGIRDTDRSPHGAHASREGSA
jgi:hypothetical protein